MWNRVSGSSVIIRASNYITESHGFRSLMKLGFFVSLFLDIVLYIYHIVFLTVTDIGHLPLVRTGKLDQSVGRLNVSTSAELGTTSG